MHMAYVCRDAGVFPSPGRGPTPRAAWGGRGEGLGVGVHLHTESEEAPPPPTPPHTRSASTLLVGEGSISSLLHYFRSYAITLPFRGRDTDLAALKR